MSQETAAQPISRLYINDKTSFNYLFLAQLQVRSSAPEVEVVANENRQSAATMHFI